ncbi:hypothetical protein DMN91_009728 [Ooceraea biroi]|uniref:AMP-dependent synthetase/ligase domain-containing protein n=1 Tax=Ooceraea biroi TaxID=2015173 RepID=A0A3L8DBK9_OOCBI|nr:hypothetical protein DMN91_009728 [Ooceraea biroi]
MRFGMYIRDKLITAPPSNLALINTDVSYATMPYRSERCAIWLQEQDVHPDDIITVLPCESIDFYVPFLAGLFIGAIVNTWDVNCKLDLDVLRRTKPKVIFADKKHVLEMYGLLYLLLKEEFYTEAIIFQSQENFMYMDLIVDNVTTEYMIPIEAKPSTTVVMLYTYNVMTVEKNIKIPYFAFLNNFYSNMPFMRPDTVGLWHVNMGNYQNLILFINALILHVPLFVWWKQDYEQLCAMLQHKVT